MKRFSFLSYALMLIALGGFSLAIGCADSNPSDKDKSEHSEDADHHHEEGDGHSHEDGDHSHDDDGHKKEGSHSG